MGKLDGRVALVTGGSSGIGFATAQEFVGEGAHVFLTGRREKELAAAVKEIGRNVTGIRADVSNSQDLDRLFCKSKTKKENSISCSRMPAPPSTHPWVRSSHSSRSQSFPGIRNLRRM